MTQDADTRELQAFQGRVTRTALALWAAALVISLFVRDSQTLTWLGVLLGGAASLGAFRYKVWTLGRLADRPTRGQARRLPVIDAGRYLILAAGFAPAVWLSRTHGSGILIAAAASLLLGSVATIVQGVRESAAAADNGRQ